MVRKSERNKHGTPVKEVQQSTRKSSRTTRRRKKSTSDSEPEPDPVPVEKESKKEVEKDSKKEVDKESKKEVDKESKKEVDKESKKEIERDSKKEIERDSKREVERDSKKEIVKDSKKEVERDSKKEVEKDSKKEVEKESKKEVEKESKKELEKESRKDEKETKKVERESKRETKKVEKDSKKDHHSETDSKSDTRSGRSKRSARSKPELKPVQETKEPEKDKEKKERTPEKEKKERTPEKDWKEDQQFWGDDSSSKPEEPKQEVQAVETNVERTVELVSEIPRPKSRHKSHSPLPQEIPSSPKRRSSKDKSESETKEPTEPEPVSETPPGTVNIESESPPTEDGKTGEKEDENNSTLAVIPEEVAEKEEGELENESKEEKETEETVENNTSHSTDKDSELTQNQSSTNESNSADQDTETPKAAETPGTNEEKEEHSEEMLKESIKKSGKTLKLSVSNEVAMEQIAKKLNERAAAKGAKEVTDEKDKKSIQSENLQKTPERDLDSTREEGEISSTDTPEPVKKSTTVIINKSKDISSKPTALKRMTEETPSAQRKRRTSNKVKPKEPQIAITSQSLKLIVPDVKPVPLEEVQEMLTVKTPTTVKEKTPERKRSLSIEDTKLGANKKKMIELKEVEVRVENDVREVKKKKPIVIDHKDDSKLQETTAKPVLDNHRAVRKISIVSDDAKALRRSPSPSAKKATPVLYITNLVRPFTVPQLKELLARTGTIAENGFYIDKIKSKCYVKYVDVEMAVETRHALHGVRWPINNPKTLKVEYASEQMLNHMLQLADEEHNAAKKQEAAAIERDREPTTWLQEKPVKTTTRRVTTTVREWDVGKTAGGDSQNSVQPAPVEVKKPEEWNVKKEKPKLEESRRRPHSPEKTEVPRKIKKKENDAPAKLLDDLFRKTKTTPCIYWLPLTTAQIAVKEEMRRQHMAEHERRLAEIRKSKLDISRRDKEKERDRERERDRDRDRDRDRRKK